MKSVEGNFENPEVNKLLVKHFKELRSVSPADSCHVLLGLTMHLEKSHMVLKLFNT